MSCMRLSKTTVKAFVPCFSVTFLEGLISLLLKSVDFVSPISENSTSNTPFLSLTTVAILVPHTMCLLQQASLYTQQWYLLRKNISLYPHFSEFSCREQSLEGKLIIIRGGGGSSLSELRACYICVAYIL